MTEPAAHHRPARFQLADDGSEAKVGLPAAQQLVRAQRAYRDEPAAVGDDQPSEHVVLADQAARAAHTDEDRKLVAALGRPATGAFTWLRRRQRVIDESGLASQPARRAASEEQPR